ncbi:uncharacterized protein LOC117331006 [Pecten maximus]|uniref:uncharacterized protein LOC117331006 n=1 Tax=Pecten maximus TaxID=6579 RepID=UPI0014591333|nr:uncharacterized protein LOC117331006 [Pecten maximus]
MPKSKTTARLPGRRPSRRPARFTRDNETDVQVEGEQPREPSQAAGNSTLSEETLDTIVERVADRVTPQLIQAISATRTSTEDPASPQPSQLSQHKVHQMDPQTESLALGHTPINSMLLKRFLKDHKDRDLVAEVVDGFTEGFHLHYDGPRESKHCQNLKSSQDNIDATFEKVYKEIRLGRIAGPFMTSPIPNLRLSPIGLVPKKDGTWRLIQHLSYPHGSSVNDFIDKDQASVHYSPFDNILKVIRSLGTGALLGKMDIKSAFRLLPVHPSDLDLLGFKIGDKVFIDKCLPMGCSISCSLFEKFASLLQWIVSDRSKLATLDHYLDDFIFAGGRNSSNCQVLMSTFSEVCAEIGVPIAEDKTALPSQVMVFLGLELNTLEMSVKIPSDKLAELRTMLLEYLGRKKSTLRDLQVLAGKLNFCARAIPPARAFIRRLYDVMSGVKCPHHFIRITAAIKEDLQTWLCFLDCFNGYCGIAEVDWVNDWELQLFTDSAGGDKGRGGAAFFSPSWAFIEWPAHWVCSEVIRDITFLELVPIAMAIFMWASNFQNKKIVLHTDNEGLVAILNRKSSKSIRVMNLLRPLLLKAMLHNIQFKARHIPGVHNRIADAISRQKWDSFQQLAPDAESQPTPIPESFLQLLCNMNLSGC